METGSRHQARERALALLYEAEMKAERPSSIVDALPVPPDAYAVALLAAVDAGQLEIDALIAELSIGWDVDRMAVVDRNVLRLAIAELRAFPDTPTAVILNEAVELASGYSTDESGRFVNGILASAAVRVRPEAG